MTPNRSERIDYRENCTVCVTYVEASAMNRLVYERPQMQLPNRPLTAAERARVRQFPDDDALTKEAKAIFADMQIKGRIGRSSTLESIFIARTAAAALEMNL